MKLKYIILVLIFAININAKAMIGKAAPSFGVDTWIQTNGKKDLDIDDFKGRVLYLYGFQSWCPACHTHGFPTLKKLQKHYNKNKNISFVAIQTTFEGFL